MSRRRWIFIGVIASVVTVAVLLLVWLLSGQSNTRQDAMPTNTSQSAQPGVTSPLTKENAGMLEAALGSTSKIKQAQALVPELRTGKWSAAAASPEGAMLTIDHSSFKVDANGYGSVNATVSGTIQAEFILHLSLVDGEWLINATEKVR